jgi:hypothetical protein
VSAWLLAGLALAAHPGVADPRAFIAERYALYAHGEGAIPALDPIVSSRLRVHLNAHDQAEGGEELIDRDWWVNGRAGEEPLLGRVDVTEEPGRDPDRRVIATRFRNHGRAALLRFHFRHEQAAWRLDEVVGEAGGRRWTLTGLLAARPNGDSYE